MSKRDQKLGTSILADEDVNRRIAVEEPWDVAVAHFSEIAIKGGNRRRFIKRLAGNIQRALDALEKGAAAQVEAHHDRIMIRPGAVPMDAVLQRASQVFGVSHVAPLRVLPLELDCMRKEAIRIYRAFGAPGASFAVRVRRSNKRYPMTSVEVERDVGRVVVEATGAPVNLTHPDIVISFHIQQDDLYLAGPYIDGPHGLPQGITGHVLALFSGGIDSPPAAWLMMRRGCSVDFIHFHVYPDPEQIHESKIIPLVRKLTAPYGTRARLFLIPYRCFEAGLLSAHIPHDMELIMFRRFMAHVAADVAREKGCAALVTGDNIAQVASQTMANLTAFDEAAGMTVFRPLLTYNKHEIIWLAREIESYEASILPYKDCCSLMARHPQTNPKLKKIQFTEGNLPMADMRTQALEECAVIHI
jgi:thiamine biosynthesis protein ThiI